MLLAKGGDYMPEVKIIEHFPATENYEVGEIYDITNPAKLIEEGKVELVDPTLPKHIPAVSEEEPKKAKLKKQEEDEPEK